MGEICKPHIKQKKLDSKRYTQHLFVYVKFEKKSKIKLECSGLSTEVSKAIRRTVQWITVIVRVEVSFMGRAGPVVRGYLGGWPGFVS